MVSMHGSCCVCTVYSLNIMCNLMFNKNVATAMKCWPTALLSGEGGSHPILEGHMAQDLNAATISSTNVCGAKFCKVFHSN